MKDDYKRRRKAEQHLIRTLPEVHPNLVFRPTHQECLVSEWECIRDIQVQGNEYIFTSTEKWCFQSYGLDEASSSTEMSVDPISQISDNELMSTHFRKPLGTSLPRVDSSYEKLNSFTFIAPDVMCCITPSVVSTYHFPSGDGLETVPIRGDVHFDKEICIINDCEFVIGSMEGHLLVFTHNRGNNLQETERVRKAHLSAILSIGYYKDTIVSASSDWSARLWNATTKKRLDILKHCAPVVGVALSDNYIVTCSYSECDTGELRVFRNKNGYTLVKILLIQHWVHNPRILNNGSILLQLRNPMKSDPNCRDYLCVVNFEHEKVLAQLKVGCRKIKDYEFLHDGRIIVVGLGGCAGVIAKLPRRIRNLITPKSAESEGGGRRLCVVM